jgi:hypothetical protein
MTRVTALGAVTGAEVHVVTDSSPNVKASADGHVWVPDGGDAHVSSSLMELHANAETCCTLSPPRGTDSISPMQVAAVNRVAWVADISGNSMTEVNAKTGALIHLIQGSRHRLERSCSGRRIRRSRLGGQGWGRLGYGAGDTDRCTISSDLRLEVSSRRPNGSISKHESGRGSGGGSW